MLLIENEAVREFDPQVAASPEPQQPAGGEAGGETGSAGAREAQPRSAAQHGTLWRGRWGHGRQ